MKLTGLTWWIDRWRTSAAYRELTLEEQGAYRNLLDEAWLNGGPLPDDDRVLAKACGDVKRWKAVKKNVLKKFQKSDGFWRNSALDLIFSQTSQRQASLTMAGKIGAAARWAHANRNATAYATAMPSETETVFIPPTPLKKGGRCPHDPKCLTKADCVVRRRRKAGL